MATDERTQEGGRVRLPHRQATVSAVTRVTPNLVRVVLDGDLQDWQPGDPGAHLKVFIPQDGAEPAMRTYTVRAFDETTKQLTLEFGTHCDGPATSWAQTVAVGDQLEISAGARSGMDPLRKTLWCLLVGDHSALPAIAAILESLPFGLQVEAIIEITDPADEIEITSKAIADVKWVLQTGEPGDALVQAVREVQYPSVRSEVFVGCEATQMRAIRHYLLYEEAKEHETKRTPDMDGLILHTRAYWKRGVVNHPDHDTGEDV